MKPESKRLPPINGRLLIAIWLGCAALAAPFAVGAMNTEVGASPAPTAQASQVDSTPTPDATETLDSTEAPSATETPSATGTPAQETTEPTASPDPTATPQTSPAQPSDSVRLIVMFTRVGWTARADVVSSVGGVIESETPELHMAGVSVPSLDALDGLRAATGVAAAEQDRTRAAEGEPSDTRFTDQWSLNRIGWPSVYGAVQPAADVVVAVLDTGVQADQPDLAARLVGSATFVDGADPDTDPNGHGTWMAGIVAATTDNALGIAGVAWGNVKVMPVTVLDADGNGLDSNIISGIVHATDSGADVILLALSSRGYSPALQAAIDYAWAHDVVVVAAAGNDGSSVPAYPAADRSVVGVAATDQGDHLTSSSNRGAAVFLAAPGAGILATDADGDYTAIDGTSPSAAIVAGAAALLRSVHPDISNAIVVARLARNAAPLASGDNAGNGRIDLARSLADSSMAGVQPTGAAPNGQGGPFIGPYTAATVVTWTGGGANTNWTNPLNWGGTAPVAGDDLVFPVGAAQFIANNDFAAATSFNSITISATGYTLTGNQVALGAGGLTASAVGATDTVSLAMSFASDRTVTVTDSGTTLTVGSVVSGAGGLVKAGAGVLALSGTNTYTGTTNVGTGTIDIQSNVALGSATSTIVASGAAVTVTGSGLTSAEPFTLNGTGIAGGGALRNVANNNTLSGAVTLGSAATVYSNSGTLTLSGAITTAGFTLTVDGSGNTSKSAGVMSGTGGLTKEGTGTLTLSAAQTYSGATTLNNGTIKLGIANGIGASSAVTVAAGKTFDMAGFSDSIGSLAGSGTVSSSVAGSVTLTTGSSNTSTNFAGTLADGSGTLLLTKAGTGTMTLSGTNTYSGATRINAGTLAVSSDGLLGTAPGSATAGQLVFGGGTLQATATFALSSNRGIAMTGTGTVLTDPTTTLSYGGVIAGAGALTKSGSGTLVLSGSNTYSGATTVSVGVMRVQSNAALGATTGTTSVSSGAAIEIDGSGLVVAEPITSLTGTGVAAAGALRNLANDNTWSGAITLAGTTRINSDAGTLSFPNGISAGTRALTVGGAGSTSVSAISGTTASLTRDGAGTLSLTATSSYTGATTVTAGTVRLVVSNAVSASSAVTVSTGAFLDMFGRDQTLGSLAGAGSVTSSQLGAVTLTVGGLNSNTTFSGVLSDGSGTVSLVKNGTGVQTMSGINTFAGTTTINAGTVSIAADSGLGTAPVSATPGQLTLNGGTLLASATTTLSPNRGVALTGNSTISTNTNVTLTYAGVMAGSGTLTKIGAGTLVLGGVNTFAGATTVTAGTVSLSADSALGTAPVSPTPGQLTFNGGTLLASATFTLDANRGVALTANGTVSTNAGVTVSYSGVIAGAGNLAKAGTGTLILGGTNTYTGITTVSAGVLAVSADAALGTAPVSAVANQLTFAGGTLEATASFSLASTRGITLTGAGTFNVDSSQTLTYSGVVAGASTLTKTGAGALVLGGTNTYSGASTVSVGILRVQSNAALGTTASGTTITSGAAIELDGAGLVVGEPITSMIGTGVSSAGALRNLANNNTWSGTLVFGSGGARINSDAGTLTLTAGITGNARPLTAGGAGNIVESGVIAITSGSVTKDGAGTLVLSGANTYTGATTINTGTLSVGTTNSVPAATAVTVASGATFDLGGYSETVLSVAGAGSITSALPGTVTLSSGGASSSTTFSGVISDGAAVISLVKTGTGTLTLSGVNTYTGSTTINGGTLLVSASMTLSANRGVALTGSGTFNVNPAITVGYAGTIAGPGNLAKLGSGTFVVSGANTYAGITTLTAGILSVSSDANLGAAPAVFVANQLTFGGGTLQATATFSLAASRGVTLSGAGTFNVDPTMTLSVPSVIAGGVFTLTKTGTGALLLTATNTYSGITALSSGVLRVTTDGALGAATAGTTIASGAALEINGSGLSIGEPVTSIIGTGVSSGGALRNLANDNTWSGVLTLGSGGARINSDSGTLTLTGGVTGNTRTITFGGAGNMTETNSIVTTTGGVTKDGVGTLTLAGTSTYTGNTTVNGGTLSIAADSNLGTAPASPTAGKLALSGGATLSVTASMTLSSTRGVAISGLGATFSVAPGATLTYAGIETGSAPVTTSGSGSIDWSGATVTTGALTIASGTLTAPNGALSVGGSLLNNSAPGAFVTNGTVSLTGAVSATLGGNAFLFNRLTVTNTGGVQMTAGVTINGLMTMSGGAITTNGNQLYVSATGSVTRTNGQVVGVFTKYIAAGTPVVTFEVGDATRYTPVALSFNGVTSAGDLSVSTTTGDHPQISSSTIDSTLSVNRYWTLFGPSIVFSSYSATFSFSASDRDVGSTPADFLVEGYDSSVWTPEAVTMASSTSTAATGITQLGDFAVGEAAGSALDAFTVVAPATASAGAAFDVTITAVDSAGNRVANYTGTIDLSSSDAFAAFSPASYTFTLADNGVVTLPLAADIYAAGNQTVTAAHGLHTGTSAAIAVSAGPFTGLLVLLPGETSAPGSPTGRTGTPDTQVANTAFYITVLAVDSYWNPVSAADAVNISSSDPLAVLPPDANMVAGSATFSVALQASPGTITATDVSDGTKTPNTSSPVPLNDTAPVASDDAFEMFADQGLDVPAPGLLANDMDPDLQPLTVAGPSPLSGPVNGTVTINSDGSFIYTPDSGFVGTDTFTYAATDGTLPSPAATVTIKVRDQSYISDSGWDPSFSGSRYLELTFPTYAPAGATVTDATLHLSYRSVDGAGTTCYYVEVYSGGSLIGSQGNAGSPVSCNSGTDYLADDVQLSEVNSVGAANDVTVRIYMSNSAGARSQINLGTVGVNWYLP